MASKTKAHIPYKLEDGTKGPGVTTVLGVLNKPALVIWANRLGLQGIDSSKYKDNLADIGTLAHQMILDYFKKAETDTSDYSKNQIDLAENCLLSFWEWEKNHEIEVVLAEQPLVSEDYRFGGTLDCFCKLDGVLTLVDFKTGKALYPEHEYQVAAYWQLLTENGYKATGVRILRIGRDETEGFDERVIYDLETGWQIFLHCLGIYELQKNSRRAK